MAMGFHFRSTPLFSCFISSYRMTVFIDRWLFVALESGHLLLFFFHDAKCRTSLSLRRDRRRCDDGARCERPSSQSPPSFFPMCSLWSSFSAAPDSSSFYCAAAPHYVDGCTMLAQFFCATFSSFALPSFLHFFAYNFIGLKSGFIGFDRLKNFAQRIPTCFDSIAP